MDLTIDAARLFASHWLLGALAEAERTALLRHSRVRAYPERARLFRCGDEGSALLAVLRGRILLSLLQDQGREISLAVVGPGEVIGEIALLDGKPRTADARALENSEVLIVERRDLMPILERSPRTCVRLLTMLCGRIRATNAQVEDLMFTDKSARIWKALRRLAASHGTTGPGGVTIDLKLSQREIGSFVGLTRESVNKQLAQWRDSGLLTIDDGKITITQPDAFDGLFAESV